MVCCVNICRRNSGSHSEGREGNSDGVVGIVVGWCGRDGVVGMVVGWCGRDGGGMVW
jgi:hypothetical protein